jgi:heat shock protein HtpX
MTMTVVIDQRALRRARWATCFYGVVLFGAMLATLAVCVWLVAGPWAVAVVLSALVIGVTTALRLSPQLVMRLHRAVPVPRGEAPELEGILAGLALGAGLNTVPVLYWLPGRTINAVAAGGPDQSAIALSDGALRTFDGRQMAAVLAHEVAHIAVGDSRLLVLGDMIARATRDVAVLGLVVCLALVIGAADADIDEIPLWLAPALAAAVPAAVILQRALSRNREFAADLLAVRLTGDVLGLVGALDAIERLSGTRRGRQSGPEAEAEDNVAGGLLRGHPPTAARVERLLAQARVVPTRPPSGIGGLWPLLNRWH